MQLASLLGIGAEPEVNVKNSMNASSSNGVDAGFLSLLVGLSSVQQIPVTAEPIIIKTDNAETNNIEVASSSGDDVKAGNPLNTPFIAETITKNNSAVNESAALSDSKNKADNALNTPLNVKPVIKTDSAEANNAEGVSSSVSDIKAGNPLNTPLIAETITKDNSAVNETAPLDDSKNKADNALNMPVTAEPVIKTDSAEANIIEETSLYSSNVKAGNPLNITSFPDRSILGHAFAENRLLGNIVFGDAIRNLTQVQENSNAADEPSIAETDETIAIDTAKSVVTMDELSRQDFIKGYKPVLNSAHQDLRLSSHNQLPMTNGLSPDISKSSPSIDASEVEDADVKLLQQSDNISNSMFNKISDEHSALSNQHSDEDDFIQSSVSRNDAVIDAGGIGKTKDILTVGKAEAHSQVDNKAVETQVVEKTAQGIRVIATDGGGRMRISLYPESLGHIRIDVSVNNDGIVNARMVTENSQVKDVIDNNISRLKESLLQQGLKIDQFSVSVDQQKQSDFSAYEEKMFWHRNPEQEMPAGYNTMTYDPRLETHDSRLAMGNVDIFV